MGFFSKLFGSKEPSIVEEDVEEVTQEPEEDGEYKCSFCGMSIASTQQVKTYNGKKWHLKPCWREVRKMAKNHNL